MSSPSKLARVLSWNLITTDKSKEIHIRSDQSNSNPSLKMLEKNRGKRRPARQNAKGDSTWHHESGASDKTAERSGKTWGSIFAAGIISAIVLSLGHFIGGGGHEEK